MTVGTTTVPETPHGWVWTVLGEIAEVNLGRTPRKTQYASEGSLKIVKFRDIVGDGIDWDQHDRGFVFDSEGVASRLSELCRGDVLVTASAHSSEHIGKKVVYVRTIPETYGKVFFVGELLCVRVYEDTANPHIVCHYLSSQDGYKAIQTHVRGVHLIASEARLIGVPLPPLTEQHRIVAKIEELFTRLDAGVEALTKIKTQLKRYRQAVLKHAFEGKLTAEWREAHRDELEPASVLLERIKQERRQRANGDYKELAPLAISDLPELPDGWVWTITSEVCSSVRDGTHDTPKYVEEGVPLVTSKNLGEHGLEFAAARSISIEDHRMISARSRVDEGDILLAMIGTIGNPVVVRTSRTFSIKNVGLFKKNAAYLNSEYLCFWLAGRAFSGILEEKKLIKGTTQRFIPLGYLRILPVPLTSLLEQHRIVEEIERRFSVADRTEKTVDQGLRQAERLRQSILKRAFEGKLVPQDPNDEPAERLLDRIREERASLQAGTKSKKTTRKRTTTQEMRLM